MKSKKGYVAVYILLAVSFIVTVFIFSNSWFVINSVKNDMAILNFKKARAINEACVETALLELTKNKNYNENNQEIGISKGSCQYLVNNQGETDVSIQSQGEFSDSVSKIEVKINQLTPKINVISWREVNSS